MAYGNLASSQIILQETPTVLYTAGSNAVVDLIVSNFSKLPVPVSVSLGSVNPANPQDYLCSHLVLAPSIRPEGSILHLRKLVMGSGDMLIVTMHKVEDQRDYYDATTTPPTWAINAKVLGIDGTDLTTARYSY